MDATPTQGKNPQAGRVEIRIQGHLEPRWSDWLDGLTLTRHDDGTTLVEGPVVDQAALFGVLDRLRDLALPLISVLHVDGPFSDHPTHPTTDRLRSQP
jgi:hypothetical protein